METTVFTWIFIGLCAMCILCIALLPYMGLSLSNAIFMSSNLLSIQLFLLYMYYTTDYTLKIKI